MRKQLKNFPFTAFLSVVLLISGGGGVTLRAESPQEAKIAVSGVVSDANGPVIGASVVEKGTSNGTATDLDGNYSLRVSSNATLEVSYLGYLSQSVAVKGQTTVNVTLQEDLQALEEVVVVGYGTQKKVNLTGSISSVDSKKLENRAFTNLSAALGGVAPGIRVTQGNGNPGSESVSIRFRGTTSFNGSDPMILIDGIVGDMNVLNPDDIESINFLKDASSAAIYGSRAAAGVILVTTKKGKREKPTVTYSGLFAQEKAETGLKYMSNMPDYMTYHNIAQLNTAGKSNWYSTETIAAWEAANANPNGIYTNPNNGNQIPNWLAYPNTDWAQEMFQATTYQKHNISVSGGSATSTYLLSLGFQDNPGTLENTSLQRYNIRANVETKIADIITVGTQTYATKEYKEPGSTDMTYLQQAYPGITPKYKGLYGGSEDPNMANMNNILHSVASQGGQNEYTRINTTWYANVDIWKGISAEAKFNYNEYMREDEHYSQNLPNYSFRIGTDDAAIVRYTPVIATAESYRYAYNSMSYTTNLILRYHGVFGKHAIDAFAGQEQYYTKNSGFSATKKGLMEWSVTDITAADEVASIGGSAKTDYAMLSYFGRLNYVYNSRYLFEGNLRSDASSRFAPKHRGDLFPSFSVGWRVSEEDFFAPAKEYVNNLKLRGSWGQLGNTVTDNYAWQETYKKTLGVFNETIANGLVISRLPNYDLMWETTTSTDLGLDASFLNNRLGLDLSYYARKTTGILNPPPVYETMGTVGAPNSNQGDMTNKGLDLDLRWNDKIGKDFRYSIGFNLNYNTNEVTKFKGKLIYEQDPTVLDINGNPTWRYTNLSDVSTGGDTRRVEGHPIDEYFLRKPYHGNGTYTNADGSVNPNGGPKDGMIRTKADLDWAKAMVAAGYSFNGNKIGSGSGEIWYGEKLMADENGDGKYGDDNDRVFTGKSSVPKLTGGFNLNAEYKGFDLSAIFAFRLGSYAYINARGANYNVLTEWTDALPKDAANMFYSYNSVKTMEKIDNSPNPLYDPNYDPANDPDANITAKYPRLYNGTNRMSSNTDYLFNTSYLKLKSLQIGYTFPKTWLSAAKISRCRVFVAGENLLTIKYKDFPAVDPELGGSVIVYPIARMYSVGLNLTF